MASKKVTELNAVSSAASGSLLYVADTTDSGSNYAGKKITKGNFLSGYATETYVGTQITNLIDGAPGALNTLNELAAALGDDADVAASLTTLINANETHIDNMATLTGVAKDAVNLGAFSGSTLADDETLKSALQDLETAVETKCTTGANVNTLVASTTADSVPSTYYFLTVDASNGAIKVVNKSFVEID